MCVGTTAGTWSFLPTTGRNLGEPTLKKNFMRIKFLEISKPSKITLQRSLYTILCSPVHDMSQELCSWVAQIRSKFKLSLKICCTSWTDILAFNQYRLGLHLDLPDLNTPDSLIYKAALGAKTS